MTPDGELGGPRVVVLTERLTRENGGASTALDVADGLRSLGYATDLVVTEDSTVLYRLSRSRKALTTLPHRNLHSASVSRIGPPAHGGTLKAQSMKRPRNDGVAHLLKVARSTLKGSVKSLERAVSGHTTSRLMQSASIVIDAGVGIGLRSTSRPIRPLGAQLVLNHNGSIEAVRDHFLGRVTSTTQSRTELYSEYLGRYDWLLFQSSDVAEEVTDAYPYFRDRHFVLSPSCREGPVLAARRMPSPYERENSPIVVVASVQPRKRQLDALEAVALLPPSASATLHFVGPIVDRDYERALRGRVRELRMEERVFIHGYRPDYARFIAHALVVLQPSSAEGVSRTLREAMILERPIVAYAIPGTSSILLNGVDSLLVESGNVTDLNAALETLSSDPALANQLGAGARGAYMRSHSWSQFLIGLEELVRMIGRAGPTSRVGN